MGLLFNVGVGMFISGLLLMMIITVYQLIKGWFDTRIALSVRAVGLLAAMACVGIVMTVASWILS